MAAHPHHKIHDRFSSARPENIKRRKTLSIILLIAIVILFSAIYFFVGRPLVYEFLESPETFRDYVHSHGPLGPVMMMGIMILQVIVAVIPGEPFELGAGFDPNAAQGGHDQGPQQGGPNGQTYYDADYEVVDDDKK